MKPDLDDYEELNDEADAPRGRAMSWVVLGLAVAGFASLAYYAYHSGSANPNGEVTVVAAEQGDIKTAPENPGGEEFPNKDKTIYDVISKDDGSEKPAEKLLPEPQQPVLENHAGDHEDDDVDALVADATQAPAAKPAAPAAVPAPAVPPAAPAAAPAPVAAEPVKPEAPATTTYVNKNLTPAAEDNAATKAPGEPTFVNEKPATAKKDEVKTADDKKPEPKKEAVKAPAKPAAKPVSPATAGGSYKVQLGAYASEAEAEGAWKKISAAHAGVLSGGPTIVQAEVNGKTYYRLRAGSFADAGAAKATCAKLGGQACIPVK